MLVLLEKGLVAPRRLPLLVPLLLLLEEERSLPVRLPKKRCRLPVMLL